MIKLKSGEVELELEGVDLSIEDGGLPIMVRAHVPAQPIYNPVLRSPSVKRPDLFGSIVRWI